MGFNPSVFSALNYCPDEYVLRAGVSLCPAFPVENVTWKMVGDFVSRLNRMDTHYSYRLPIESEWEVAARAGSRAAYGYGEDARDLNKYGWFYDNSRGQSQRVASLRANPNGLYDMNGNVWEMVAPPYHALGEMIRFVDPGDKPELHVMRGGAWDKPAVDLRMAYRFPFFDDSKFGGLGFRLVRTKR